MSLALGVCVVCVHPIGVRYCERSGESESERFGFCDCGRDGRREGRNACHVI